MFCNVDLENFNVGYLVDMNCYTEDAFALAKDFVGSFILIIGNRVDILVNAKLGLRLNLKNSNRFPKMSTNVSRNSFS